MEVKKSFPQVALRSYLKLKDYPQFLRFTQAVITTLSKILNPIERVRFVHDMIDQEMSDLNQNEAVKKLTACQKGCAACCHTQVSVTKDEANLLTDRIMQGHPINWDNFHLQVKAENNTTDFMSINYKNRACLFLDSDNACSVYEDRPSVCRTNAVVGNAEQCKNDDGQFRTQQILNTYNADMIIMGAYMHSEENGALPSMIWKSLCEKNKQNIIEKEIKNPGTVLKEVFKPKSLG